MFLLFLRLARHGVRDGNDFGKQNAIVYSCCAMKRTMLYTTIIKSVLKPFCTKISMNVVYVCSKYSLFRKRREFYLWKQQNHVDNGVVLASTIFLGKLLCRVCLSYGLLIFNFTGNSFSAFVLFLPHSLSLSFHSQFHHFIVSFIFHSILNW